MKILANSLLITGVASLAEAIATARQQAIPDEFLDPPCRQSGVKSRQQSPVGQSARSDASRFVLQHSARKDLRLAIDLAEETGVGVASDPQPKPS